MEHDIACNAHGILQVSLNLVEHVLGGAAEKDGAGLGVLALGKEGKVLVANLLNLKQTASGANIRILEILYPVNDCGAGGTSYSVVVGLSDSAESCDVGLHEVVLSEVYTVLVMPSHMSRELETHQTLPSR